KGRKAWSCALKARNTVRDTHPAEADAASAIANSSPCNVSATTEPSAVETATAKSAAATTTMTSRPCDGTERHGCDANYQSNNLSNFHTLKLDRVSLGSYCVSAGYCGAT